MAVHLGALPAGTCAAAAAAARRLGLLATCREQQGAPSVVQTKQMHELVCYSLSFLADCSLHGCCAREAAAGGGRRGGFKAVALLLAAVCRGSAVCSVMIRIVRHHSNSLPVVAKHA